MIIEIEFYQGDTLLSGKQIPYVEFLRQLGEIEADYDRTLDNFVALFCRRYGWTIVETSGSPVYIYDRDIQKAYQAKRN